MKQVYVYFDPILVEMPDAVVTALSSIPEIAEPARIMCAEEAVKELSKVHIGNAKKMVVAMLSRVVVA